MSQNLNSAGKIAKIFINHPLTGILGIFFNFRIFCTSIYAKRGKSSNKS